jgi:hypothetical protein
VDLLPILAQVTSTYAWFFLTGLKLRGALLFATGNWIGHNLMKVSLGPLIMEMLQFARNGRTIYLLRNNQSPKR